MVGREKRNKYSPREVLPFKSSFEDETLGEGEVML
jgi:hypothetical protein